MREKCQNTKFFSSPYFPVVSPKTGKYGPEKTPYLDKFHIVNNSMDTNQKSLVPEIIHLEGPQNFLKN